MANTMPIRSAKIRQLLLLDNSISQLYPTENVEKSFLSSRLFVFLVVNLIFEISKVAEKHQKKSEKKKKKKQQNAIFIVL
jgi:hypothetical protein